MSRKTKFLNNAFEFILYNDSPKHIEILDKITNSNDIRYIGCCHDKDTYSDEDLSRAMIDNREIDWKVGDIKKTHYHIYIYFNIPTCIDDLIKIYGIEKNNIEFISSEKDALIYLLHRNRPDKYQYQVVDIFYNDINLFNKLKKYINQYELKDENLGASKIIKFINEKKNYCSVYEVSTFVLNNDLWSVYRRGFAVFNKIIQEHNLNLEKE